MARGVKKKDYENITDASVKKVISLLNSSPPITKKEACEILNISYNTARLNKIIEEFEHEQDIVKRMKAKKRGRPATKDEIRGMIEGYLEGASYSDISKSTYRSVAFVKSIIERVGVPERITGDDRYKIEYLPDECVAETFELGEIAWSAKYHSSCIIKEKLDKPIYQERYGCECYNIYINEETEGFTKGGFYAAAPAYDLGKLNHLKEYGISTDNI
jgi:hypothetical protein